MNTQESKKILLSEGSISVKILRGDAEKLFFRKDATVLDLTTTRLLDCEYKLDVMSKREGEPLYYTDITFDKTTIGEIVFDCSSLPISPRMHAHDYFEIAVIDKGDVTLQVETVRKVYHPGDVLIISRGTRHTEDLIENAVMYSLCMSHSCLRTWFAEDYANIQISKTLEQFVKTNTSDEFKPDKEMIEYLYTGDLSAIEAVKLLQEICREMDEKKPGYRLMTRALTCRFFALLNDSGKYQAQYSNLGEYLNENLARSVKLYLDNTKRKVNRSEISAAMHYSDNHINRIFKMYFDMTVMEYNRHIYMKEAAKLLATTDMPISKIVTVLNLESKTHFYRKFSDIYAMTPTEYRMRNGTKRK